MMTETDTYRKYVTSKLYTGWNDNQRESTARLDR